MRKYIKNQVTSISKTVFDAICETKKRIEKQDYNAVNSLLPEIQNAVIEMGNMVEDAEGEGCNEVHILESICEQIYEISVAVSEARKEDAIKATKKILNEITEFDRKIKALDEQLEVVFLPYKADMWDSLESVWKKYSQDKSCKTFVIPIPYFEKNPDGSVNKVIYEGDRFPKDVPITHYDHYSLEKNHPDIIYIHNPYDECNFVTSIHPYFYSSKIKDYTEQLIYIPYFVLAEPNLDSDEYLEFLGNYVLVPGVIHADKVIVQSEEMKKAYVKVLDKEYGNQVPASYWENKIEGTGSPKFDKLKELDNVEIPEEWIKYVTKSDGRKKKIVLYNISVSTVLKEQEQLLDKMERVFDLFEENKDKITLLFRPHPLTESTLISMRPALYERYLEIVNKYKEADFGIYDDTPEMDRALAISDAYYGTPSSLVQLYQKMGKPIMIQNSEI